VAPNIISFDEHILCYSTQGLVSKRVLIISVAACFSKCLLFITLGLILLLLNLSFTIIEFLGGILTNSKAIMADAVHD
jgi:hypothetical protein